jgi:hypothetical protein
MDGGDEKNRPRSRRTEAIVSGYRGSANAFSASHAPLTQSVQTGSNQSPENFLSWQEIYEGVAMTGKHPADWRRM